MATNPITELQRCLALVRPVGMNDAAVKDWLTAAVAEINHLPPNVLAMACDEVRKTVSHHGQIVPAILKSFAVRSNAEHEREVKRMLADGHVIAGRNAPQIEKRGGTNKIGHLKLVEDHRD